MFIRRAAFLTFLSCLRQSAASHYDTIKNVVDEVTNSGVHGVAFPLDYVHLNHGSDTQQQMSIQLSVDGADNPQNVLIDTGSSTLAFCDSTIANKSSSLARETNYASCKTYSSSVDCAGGGQQGSPLAWAGPVYQGDVVVYDSMNGTAVSVMENVSYAIMENIFNFYGCDEPLSGIIGVGFTGGNEVKELPSDGSVTAAGTLEECLTTDGTKAGFCNPNLPSTTVPTTIEQTLKQYVDVGYNFMQSFGLYLDYQATKGADVNTVIPALGIYFGGDMAFDNPYYNGGTPQSAVSRTTYAWYTLNLTSIRVPSANLNFPFHGFCDDTKGNCITDTGNSYIELPLPPEECIKMMEQASEGSLFIDLEGVDGGVVTLELPIPFLIKEYQSGEWIQCTGGVNDTRGFKIGMPIFQHYYLVHDMGNKTVTFVDLPTKSNDTNVDYPPTTGPPKSNEFGTGVTVGSPEDTSSGYLVSTGMAGLLLAAVVSLFSI